MITGLNGLEVICGGRGNDTINGGNGGDTVEGGSGDDAQRAGATVTMFIATAADQFQANAALDDAQSLGP